MMEGEARLGKAVVEFVFLKQNKEKLLRLLTQHLPYTRNPEAKKQTSGIRGLLCVQIMRQ